jgi:hypothetical protein
MGQTMMDPVHDEHTLIRMKVEGEPNSVVWIIRRMPDGFRPGFLSIAADECVWTGPPGQYDIDIISVKDNQLVQKFQRVIIQSKSNPPTPPVPPGPNPKPKPGENATYRELSDYYYEGLSQEAKQYSKGISDNYISVAAAISAGGIKKVQDAFDTVKAKNRDVLKDKAVLWKEWFDPIQAKLIKDFDSGTIGPGDLSKVRTIFEELSAGILE